MVDIFQANGLEVVEVTSGDRVRLAWSVSGNVTGIEIKSLSTSEQYFPAEKQGSLLTQPLTENTQYTLVASNGTAKSNPPKQVNVIIKPPPGLQDGSSLERSSATPWRGAPSGN